MDPAAVLQTVLSVIQSGTVPENIASTPSQSSAVVPPPTSNGTFPDATPSSLPELLASLLSINATQLLVIGAFVEALRRLFTMVWENAGDDLWLTASFEWDDDTTDWIMYWLSRRGVFNTARSIEVSNYCYGLKTSTIEGLEDDGWEDGQMSFIPSLSKTYSLWYRGRYMTIRREKSDRGSYYRPVQVLQLRIFSRDPRLLRSLLLEARQEYQEASQHVVNVYVAESADRWKHVAKQEKRPISSVILDPGVLELVLNDAKDFLHSKKWYADRGIPFRRGYLLYGAPGAGKTSMIHSIAGELGLNIYILSLTMMALDDNSLKSLIAHLPQSCILLIEDIDAAFHRGVKRDIQDPEKEAKHSGGKEAPAGPQGEDGDKMKQPLYNGVTLSGVLNALDGIAAQEGRILFATTNDYSALDPALLRPGRLDLHIEFQLASQYQARELFRRFYTTDDDATSSEGADVDEKVDSGYASSSSEPAHDRLPGPPCLTDGDSTLPSSQNASSSFPEGVQSVYVGMERGSGRLPSLSKEEVLALADRFASIIPPRAFSMATLQGYLMAYKIRPLEALADAPAWVTSRQQEKQQPAAASDRSEKQAGAKGDAAIASGDATVLSLIDSNP
ncbi:P-loop containing nucleoside triphosphate hydrolase protein [Trametes sanguinea]|nr:P-loop containing nucleoside triphosphate hydrolase protein [Trametes sanguinea]